MSIFTFSGGIHPGYYKDISISEPLRKVDLPDTVIIPLSQHIGAPNKALVKKGDNAEEGQMIGQSDSFISSPVHASVSGKVLDIKKAFHPVLGDTEAVYIERDKEKEPKRYKAQDVDDLSPKEIIEKIRSAGVVGMGGAAFPTHVKLSVPDGKKIETLIVNGAECEPYLTCDHSIMNRKTLEILKGIEILIKLLSPEKVYLAIEDNKKSAIFAFKKAIKDAPYGLISRTKVSLVETKYPQGGEKQLIKALTGKEVPPGGLPLDIGFLVHNVGTIYAIYEAVYYDKPLIERIITISGDCMHRPGNYKVRIGTTLEDVINKYGIELYKNPKKIVFGGPMMGIAQPEIKAPILKSTSGILFLSGERIAVYDEERCIRCAKCVDVCPVRLIPTDIMKNVKRKKWDRMKELCVSDCMECGSCSYVCPARIPLVQYIKEGKAAIDGKK
ncbi:MAG: electron transport complex subunit RsxC [Candidatus Omnitrophota bacterium]|nr:electron transport complex subunit RsxC [Candidatus Omnitrophota bacterium]